MLVMELTVVVSLLAGLFLAFFRVMESSAVKRSAEVSPRLYVRVFAKFREEDLALETKTSQNKNKLINKINTYHCRVQETELSSSLTTEPSNEMVMSQEAYWKNW